MNRRSFLATASAAGGALAIPTLFTGKANALVSIDTSSLYSAAAFHASAIRNHLNNTPSISDWENIAIATQGVVNMWKASNLDVVLRPAFNTVTEPMITSSRVNCAQISANLAPYHSMSASQIAIGIQTMFNKCNLYYPGMITSALNTVRTTGMATYLQGAVNEANLVVANWKITPSKMGIVASPDNPQPHPQETCLYSGMGMLFAGIAICVVTVMTGGTDILVGAAWGAILYWAGIGLTGWSIVHDAICN